MSRRVAYARATMAPPRGDGVRFAVDATSIGSGLGGDETLIRAALRGLATEMGADDELLILAAVGARLPAEVVARPRITVDEVPRRPGIVHFALDLPRWLGALPGRDLTPDVVLCTTHAPLWAPRPAVPVALMVTDLSFLRAPETYPVATRWRLRLLVRHQVHRAVRVLTISEFCRADLIDAYHLPPGRVDVVPLAVDPPVPASGHARERLATRGVRSPYLLYLGNRHPRKNVPRTLAAFLAARERNPELAGHQMVVAGRPWFGDDRVERLAETAPVGSVVVLDRVDDEEREVLLRDAAALAYLSTFEGFGLPPLEAMARDTPVLASDATAIPEVCGDAALLTDPLDAGGIQRGVEAVLLDGELRQTLQARGRDRVAHYDVRRTGAALRKALCAATNQPLSRRV